MTLTVINGNSETKDHKVIANNNCEIHFIPDTLRVNGEITPVVIINTIAYDTGEVRQKTLRKKSADIAYSLFIKKGFTEVL